MKQSYNEKGFHISAVESIDYSNLTAIWESSVRATHDFLSEEDIAFFRPLILNQYLKNLELYCVKIDDVITGFLGIESHTIEMLFVAPEYMDRGIGRFLLDYAVAQRNCDRVDVNEQNTKAVTFYAKYGFAVFGRSETDNTGKAYPLLHMEYRSEKNSFT